MRLSRTRLSRFVQWCKGRQQYSSSSSSNDGSGVCFVIMDYRKGAKNARRIMVSIGCKKNPRGRITAALVAARPASGLPAVTGLFAERKFDATTTRLGVGPRMKFRDQRPHPKTPLMTK